MTANNVAMTLSLDKARELGLEACHACGANRAVSNSLVEATISAEIHGRPEVGFRHLLDYLQGFVDGRIARDGEPSLHTPLPTIIHSDAASGIAQLGFDLAYDKLTEIGRNLGTALFTQNNSYTAGELGYYVRRLAGDGFISIAVANGPALLSAAPGGKAVYCTNPMAFGAPCIGQAPLVIDQASSATAFVSIIKAAETYTPLPDGWALDATGQITTDARSAIAGSLLPFGGYKGANIALMVEVLSAGISGATWSIDAPDFRAGAQSPAAGMTIIVLSPQAIVPRFEQRLSIQLKCLQAAGVRVPGMRPPEKQVVLERSIAERIMEFAAGVRNP